MTDYEAAFWQTCANTFHEEQKQLAYAPRMGLRPIWDCAHPPTFDLEGRSVIDIGGGPVSLLLKCVNGLGTVADPGNYPYWVIERYKAADIAYWQIPGEELPGSAEGYDEAWIYNVLQHTDDPALVIANALRVAKTIRLFEWIDIPAYEGHPHELTRAAIEGWLGAPGFVAQVNESGAVGRAFYGVFSCRAVPPVLESPRGESGVS